MKRETSRKAFEKWAKSQGYYLLRDNEVPEMYDSYETCVAFLSWQAALRYARRKGRKK